MSLKTIPESDKPMWRQLFQNARGRADLKQPAGFLTLFTLLYCAALGVAIADVLVMTLGGVVLLWWVGDTTEAVTVLKALYGGYQQKANTEIKTEETTVDSQNTTINPATGPNVEHPAP